MTNSTVNVSKTKVDARTKRRALQARDRIHKIIAEIKKWKGVTPTVVHVNHADYLALVEVGWVDRFPNIEVKPG